MFLQKKKVENANDSRKMKEQIQNDQLETCNQELAS